MLSDKHQHVQDQGDWEETINGCLPFTPKIWKFFGWNVNGKITTVFVDTRLWKTNNARGNVSKISVSLACYRHIGSESTNQSATSVTFRPSLRHAGGL